MLAGHAVMGPLRPKGRRFVLIAGLLCLFSGIIVLSTQVSQNSTPATKPHNRSQPISQPRAQANVVANYGKLPLSFEANEGQTDPSVKFLARGSGYALFLTGNVAVLSLRKPNGKVHPGRAGLPAHAAAEAHGAGVAPGFSAARGLSAYTYEFTSPNATMPATTSQLTSPNATMPPSRAPLHHQRELPTDTSQPQLPNATMPPSRAPVHHQRELPTDTRQSTDVLRLQLLGANKQAPVAGAEELPGRTNYFIGNDPKKWRTDVPTYAQVKYQGVYPGVDLVYYGNQSGQLEYDFVVEPGADPAKIRLAVDSRRAAVGSRQAENQSKIQNLKSKIDAQGGQSKIQNLKSKIDADASQSKIQNLKSKIDSNGDLIVKLADGDVRFHKPLVYQEQSSVDSPQLTAQAQQRNTTANPKSTIQNRKFLEGRYVLEANNEIGFEVAAYDHSRPLVIDPVLSYSTYLGGAADDWGYGITVDSSTRNAYVTGYTSSTNFPYKGGWEGANQGGEDGFVTELNSTGSGLVYSTYIGGSSTDEFERIALDSSKNVVVVGDTTSTNYPTKDPLPGVGSTYATGGYETVVTKLNAAGNGLIYSTYLGGVGDTFPEGLCLDSNGDAYIAGESNSSAYPVLHAIQGTNTGDYTGTLTRLHWDGTSVLSLVYSTYWGVGETTSVNGVAADNNGNVYIGGFSYGSVPTQNPIYAWKGGYDGFVSKLNWNAGTTTLSTVYSTYLGGSEDDSVIGLAIDSSGDVYVTGYTSSQDFPMVHAYQDTNYSSDTTAFVAEVNPGGTALVYSTYLGGSGYDRSNYISLSPTGTVYVTGYTTSTDFPTVNPIQATCNACTYSPFDPDVFLTGLHWNGTELRSCA